MQCPACNKEVAPQSAFCNNCGAPVTAAAADPTPGYTTVPNQPYATVPQQPVYAGPPVVAGAGLSDNAASAIAYLTIIPAIIFLVLEPYNKVPLIRFHSWQSIGLFVAAVLLQVAVTIADIMLHFIPFIILLFSLIHLALGLGLFLVWIFVLLKASKGEWYKLPIIGDFAEKQARG